MRPPLNRIDPSRTDPFPLNRILLIRLRRIGDIVMTTPAVEALKAALPAASLTYMVEEPYRRLVEGHSCLDEVIVVGKDQTFRDVRRVVRRVRKKRFDAVLDFHGGPRASLLALLSGARLKIGYKVRYKSFIYHIKVPRAVKNGYVHSVENHVNLVKGLGVGVAEIPRLSLPRPQPADVRAVDDFFVKHGLRSRNVVALHIGAGNRFRDWGTANTARLASRLARLPETSVVLIGGDEDRDAEKNILASSPDPLLSLTGRIDLIGLKELISRAALFVGPDSGPMHIAAATETPIVAYFGPTLPANFSPWKSRARIVEKELGCRPCRQRECITGDFRCLQAITVEDVFEACREFIP